ncbi:hypothetical protein RUND412_005890 [Rhizina undulata]
MPTPNEVITESPTSLAGVSRPLRPQLACPEERPNPSSTTRRQNVPPEAAVSESGSPTMPASDENPQEHAAASTKESEVPTEPQSVPSPTVAQKTFSSRPVSYTSTLSHDYHPAPSMSHEFSTKRMLPSTSSYYLRSGSKFIGKQTSDRSTYEVQVELKHVDMSEAFLCGYLRIKGLTEDHPTLTTYFEGEMIGDKYTFQTRRPEWGSSDKNDFQHWARFPAYRPLATKAKRVDFHYKDFAQREYIFMRWKEYFLVPDHTVKQISGASFEGFYYICFNQVSGSVSGIYFHAKSEKFQKLDLNHVPEKTFGAIEFR